MRATSALLPLHTPFVEAFVYPHFPSFYSKVGQTCPQTPPQNLSKNRLTLPFRSRMSPPPLWKAFVPLDVWQASVTYRIGCSCPLKLKGFNLSLVNQ